DDEAGVVEIARTTPTTTDPADVVRIPARITRQILERCGDILRACLDGALAHVIDEGGRRHRAGARATAERLAALGALDTAVSIDDAAVTIATLADLR